MSYDRAHTGDCDGLEQRVEEEDDPAGLHQMARRGQELTPAAGWGRPAPCGTGLAPSSGCPLPQHMPPHRSSSQEPAHPLHTSFFLYPLSLPSFSIAFFLLPYTPALFDSSPLLLLLCGTP